MNNSLNTTWPGQEQLDHMPTVSEQDFSTFLDLSDIDLDFPIYDTHAPDAESNNQQFSQLPENHEFQNGQNTGLGNSTTQLQHLSSSQNPLPDSGGDFFGFIAPPFGLHQDAQSSYAMNQDSTFQSHRGVPPTPNSVEMHGNPAHYLAQLDPQTRAILEQRFQLRKEDAVAFTPLVSPAVTPHDARFQISQDGTVPGSYFSPLVSPALEAQSQGNKRSYAHSQYASGSSSDTSPVDLDVDMLGDAAMPSTETSRRPKSKPYTSRSVTSTPRVRPSPVAQPRRRKATLTSSVPPKEVADLLEEAQKSKAGPSQQDASPRMVHSHENSEAESISPEPLSESLMGPPPRPGSLTQSPSIIAQANNSPVSSQGLCPATPASLMRLQKSPGLTATNHSPSISANLQTSSPIVAFTPVLEDFTLPEAAASSRCQTVYDGSRSTEDQTTPRLPARKTPRLGPLSTPSADAALSGKASPMLSAINSPTSPRFPGRKSEPKNGRTSKKRNSISSTLVSPALRPKISPSIKPMLPEGALSDETHALLLASKSNYQNILEGTHIPGVSYPEALSTNLTSKRTSHKIAEQGRRNRINTALAEMQMLLPQPVTPKEKEKEVAITKSPRITAQQSNSKAATVESAIEFIRFLKQQASEQDRQMKERDKELEALRKRLNELEGKSSPGPATSHPHSKSSEAAMVDDNDRKEPTQ